MKNSEYFSVLNTNLTVDAWWNSLSHDDRVDIGGIAIHFNLITANCRSFNLIKDFNDLSSKQKTYIRYIYNKKDTNFSMFPMTGNIKVKI